MSGEITVENGVHVGPLRAPQNEMRRTEGNIHSDVDARRLGFRGGLVAGSIHMEQFAPVLVRAFGERWFQRGSISLYFLQPTVHGEDVRCFLGVPPEGAPDVQVEAWMEKADGTRICEGTAAVGEPAEPSALRARQIDRHPPGELRILADVRPGDEMPVVETRVEREALDRRVRVVTEPMPWYSDTSRWGGLVPTTVNQVNALMAPASAYLRERQRRAIGLYGAIELRNVNGPLLCETAYRAGGTILFAGDTPKTEYVWFDTWAEHPSSGDRVVEMRMMLRFMKASSPVYQEQSTTAGS